MHKTVSTVFCKQTEAELCRQRVQVGLTYRERRQWELLLAKKKDSRAQSRSLVHMGHTEY